MSVGLASVRIVELGSLTGAECVAHARELQRAHNASGAARFAAALEVGLCAPGSGERVERMAAPDRYSVDELRAMYALSIGAAHKLLDLAWAVCRRLPELYEAMADGELDETRAWAMAHWTEQLSDEHAHLVCAEVMPHCLLSAEEPWVTGKVIAEIKKLAIALDPEWAERMYADAIRRRRVAGWRNPDGSADLAGQQLEVDRVAAACGRLRELGKRAKRDGDPRPIDAIRADLFLGMLDGTYEGLSAEEILDDYAKTRPEPDTSQADTRRSDTSRPDAARPRRDDLVEALGESGRQSPGIGVQLRVKLSTLLGWDAHPGELAGWGPLDPAHTRRLAHMLSHGTWRIAIVDAEGQLIWTSLCTKRPEGWRPRKAWAKGILDLLVPLELLGDVLAAPFDPLVPDIPPEWHPVLAELVRIITQGTENAERHFDELEGERDDAEFAGSLAAVLARQDEAAGAARRFPREDLRRRLELKVSTCIGYTCTRPSEQAEMDHTRDHAQGGPTLEDNLGPACGHDHDLKTKGGWYLERLDEHRYCWITRLGQRYTVDLQPVIEKLPGPGPAPQRVVETIPDPDRDSTGRRWQTSNPWCGDGPRAQPPLPPDDRERPCSDTDEAA